MVLSALLLACVTTPRGDSDATATAAATDTAHVSASLRLDGALHADLLAALQAATTRIDVVQYTLYDSGAVTELVDAVIAAHERGVVVRVLADEEASGTQDTLDRLTAAGVDAQLDSADQTTHNKLVLVDDTAFVGSHNWSTYAMSSNHEGSVRIDDPQVTAFYDTVFESLWSDSSVPLDPAWTGAGPVTPLTNRQVAPALLACIDGAVERIRLVLYALAYDERYPDSDPALLVAAFGDAQARGVDVQLLLDASDWITDNGINDDAIALLRAADVPVFHTPGSVTTHAKVLVCDDTTVVSDANWSYSSLALYNGTSARIVDGATADQVAAWWAELQAEGQ
jgi:phosphatidylserine/phosphatidylglycerophosphate/cardiolipin synthase-like enzyme